MNSYSFTHLSDHAVLSLLAMKLRIERRATAEVLALIAEAEARALHLAAGYSSMFRYCVDVLHLSDQAAYRRINVSRAGRRFPEIFPALAEGRLHMTAVELLIPRLTEDTAHDLIEAAVHKTKSDIQMMLVARFPRPDVPTLVRALRPARPADVEMPQLSPAIVEATSAAELSPAIVEATSAAELSPAIVGAGPAAELSLAIVGTHEAMPAATPAPFRPRVTPLSPARYQVQFTMSQSMKDKLEQARNLLGHQVPSGDIPAVLELALDALIARLEKTKYAATARPRKTIAARAQRDHSRHIPAAVKRAVRERDGNQCTYVSATGHRCGERRFLEFDHAEPFANGGRATVALVRLRCRAHNQYTAGIAFGRDFIENKRQESAMARAVARERSNGMPSERGWKLAHDRDDAGEVIGP